MTDTSEKGLEAIIVTHLVEQNGYAQGTNQDYNADYALDTARIEAFLCDTQPQKVAESLAFASSHNKHQFFERLKNEITKRGIIDVLRKGYRYNTNHFDMYFPLPSELNDTAKQFYEKISFPLFVSCIIPKPMLLFRSIWQFSLMGCRLLLLSSKINLPDKT